MMVAFIRQRLCEKGFGDVLAYCSATYVPENSIANSCKIISVDWNNDICSREVADCRERQGRVERCSPPLACPPSTQVKHGSVCCRENAKVANDCQTKLT